MPRHFRGRYYSLESTEGSNNLYTTIKENSIEVENLFNGNCVDYEVIANSTDADDNFDAKMLFNEPG